MSRLRHPRFPHGLVAAALATSWTAPAGAIIGGTEDPGDPAVVALLLSGTTYCTGTLIADRLVLTAGHCAFDVSLLPVTAAAGPDAAIPSDEVDVIETYRHPSYTRMGADNDVGTLVLARPLAGVTPLSLSNHVLGDVDIGHDIRHVGYGVSDEAAGTGRGIRRTVTYPVTALSPTKVTSGAPGKQTCTFDSGGPAFWQDEDGVERLIAVVSDGPTCHDDGWDIRVDSVRPFIDQQVARLQPDGDPAPRAACDAAPPSLPWLLAALAALRRRWNRSPPHAGHRHAELHEVPVRLREG